MSLFSQMLSQGDRKEVAQGGEVAAIVLETPVLLAELLDCVVDGDETLKSHGAHALMQEGAKVFEGPVKPFCRRQLAGLITSG